MSLDFATIEDAVWAWVQAASGLAESNVIWGNQNAAQPTGTYCSIRIGDDTPLGSVDSVQRTEDLSQVGQELAETATGAVDLPVDIECFASDATGNGQSRAVLSAVRRALSLDSPRGALNAAGLACYDKGSIKSMPAIAAADFQSRSILSTRFYAWETAVERVGYIATVQLVNRIT